MSERTERITEIKEKLEAIDLYYKDIENKRKALHKELCELEETLDVGERGYYEETCRQGCCVDRYIEGVVKEVLPRQNYILVDDNGAEHSVWRIKRKK